MSANNEVIPTPRRDPDTLVLSEDPLHVGAELILALSSAERNPYLSQPT
jgi:hypothetical protein